ncbi:MAG: hypothetical protein KAS53_09460 [Candidatus Cloacimonetes bacterium]|nr:hypothetical protein [Candidatus Cloacimonadota bacterium]
MERKEVSAILQDDFIEFLKQNNLYDSYMKKELLCEYCQKPISEYNVFTIYFDTKIKFCCDNEKCIEFFNKRKKK